jgi:hypothetical protein
VLDATEDKSGLSEADADKLAVDEVRAARRERSSAA